MLTYKRTFCMTFLTCKVTQWPTQTTQHDHQSRHNMAEKSTQIGSKVVMLGGLDYTKSQKTWHKCNDVAPPPSILDRFPPGAAARILGV